MIKIENVSIVGWEPAIRGARNPMNSWEKSDSLIFDYYDTEYDNDVCHTITKEERILDDSFDDCSWTDNGIHLGPNDLKLLTNLAKAGSDEAKFRRMIVVYLDVTAPMYWWKEADTYKVGTVRNSCSTMHKIHAKEFTLEDFSTEHLNGGLPMLAATIDILNIARGRFLKSKSKEDWWQMIQLLPSSYNQRATLMLNYEVLANMYHARKNHKLDEWREFCKWIETLPYAKELIIGGETVTETEEKLRARFKSYEDRIRYLEGMMCKELYKAYDMSIEDISEKTGIAVHTVKYFINGGE